MGLGAVQACRVGRMQWNSEGSPNGDHRVALHSDHRRTLFGIWCFSIVCDLELVI